MEERVVIGRYRRTNTLIGKQYLVNYGFPSLHFVDLCLVPHKAAEFCFRKMNKTDVTSYAVPRRRVKPS